VEGRGAAEETPVGLVPARNALTLDGLQISPETMEELLSVNPEDWEDDLADSKLFFDKFGSRLPRELREEHEKLSRRLSTKGASLARSG
jgi:phosphoenolpyruvate carboxykinase (GTP)